MWGCLTTTGEEIILMASVGHYPICVGHTEFTPINPMSLPMFHCWESIFPPY
jgi:hypothetical protein